MFGEKGCRTKRDTSATVKHGRGWIKLWACVEAGGQGHFTDRMHSVKYQQLLQPSIPQTGSESLLTGYKKPLQAVITKY